MKLLRTRTITLFVTFVMLFVMVVGAASSADLTGTGPDFAMTPVEGWVELQPGEYDWYAFKLTDPAKAVEIKLFSTPNEGATLTLRNGEQAQLWRSQGKHEHFGCCTPVATDKDKDGKGDYALWSAKMESKGTYFMVVEHARDVSGPVQYRIQMTSAGISFPADAPTPTEACDCEEEAAAPAPVAMVGTGPDDALPMPSGWVSLNPGENHWYQFSYGVGRNTKYEDQKTVEIKLYSDPSGAADAQLLNGSEVQLWRQDGTFEHFGCCTDANVDGDKDGKADYRVWSGKLGAGGTYYVVVQHARNSTAPANYRIEVSGL